MLFCSRPRTNNKITESIVATRALAGAVSLGGYVVPVYSPSVGKPGSGIIFLIVNQNITKNLMVIQLDYSLLCFQCSNLMFTRLLQYFIFCGNVQNIRFSNGFRRIPFHYKISNVCIEDLVLSLMTDEFERQLLCFLYCHHIVSHVVIGFWEDVQMFVMW